jgi:protein TonB
MASRFSHYAASLLAHGAMFAALGQVRQSPPVAELPARTEFVPLDLPPPPPPPELPPEPEQVESPPLAGIPPPKAAPRLAPLESIPAGSGDSAVEIDEATQRAPLRLRGVSLSNAAPSATVAATSRQRPAPAAAVQVTAIADLSRRPVPPRLDASLKNHYPAELRRRGVEGEALVRVHVSERGRVTRVEPISQSEPAFSSACRQTLLDTEWGPPLDQGGTPVRTHLLYRCRFRVGS